MRLNLDERIYMFSNYVKQRYGKRTFRVGLSTGIPCPNRMNNGGCIYCNPGTFTGEYQAQGLTIAEQFQQAVPRIKKSCGDVALIAYFQDETSTAGDIDHLFTLYNEAIQHPEVVALTLSTRPDYVDEMLLRRLSALSKPVTIEFGMQTIHDSSLRFLNRGHDFVQMERALDLCESFNIRTGVHLIIGIPGETHAMMRETIDYLTKRSNIAEVKFHNLVVYEDTTLDKMYREDDLHIPELTEYIGLLADLLSRLRGDIVVSRLFTSNVRQSGIARNVFPGNKTKWMNQLRLYLIEKNIIQGDKTDIAYKRKLSKDEQ